MKRLGKPLGAALLAGLLCAAGLLASRTRQPARPARSAARARTGREAGAPGAAGAQPGGTAAATGPALIAHVTGLDGRAAIGVEVVLAGSGVWPPRKAETGADGTTTFDGVPAGVYELRAQHDRAVAEPLEGLDLGAGERRDVFLSLQPGRAIVGRVLDAETEVPIAGARVVVGEDALAVTPRVVASGALGEFTVEPLLDRLHRVSVRADGYVSELGLEVMAGDPVFEIRLHRGAILSGVVLDARGAPVEGAQIEVLGLDLRGGAVDVSAFGRAMESADFDSLQGGVGVLRPAGELGVLTGPIPPIPGSGGAPEMVPPAPGVRGSHEMVSGPGGEFVVQGVPPGRLIVAASHPSHARGESRTIVVAAGAVIDGIEIVLEDGHRVSGRVVDDGGFPVAGATVELRGEKESPRYTVTQRSGEFSFEAMEGLLVLRATAARFDPTVRTLRAAQAEEIELRLTPSAPLVPGRIEDDRGYPVASATIRLTPQRPGLESTVVTSSEDGTFEVALPQGVPAHVEASHPDHPSVELRVTVSDRRAGLHIVMQRGGGLEGTVVAENGNYAVSPFALVVTGEERAPVRQRVEDLDGIFRVTNLLPGRYTVRITSNGFAPWEHVVEVPAPRVDEKITAPALRVELLEGRRIAGRVVDARRDPVPGVRVRTDRPALVILGAGDRPAVTDASGHFAIEDLPEGAVTLWASHPDLGTVQNVFDLSRRSAEDVEIAFEGELGREETATDPVRFGGLAIVLEGDVIGEVLEGSEAERAGLRAGDRILQVDGEGLHGQAVARALRGPAGTQVLVQVRRGTQIIEQLVLREVLYH